MIDRTKEIKIFVLAILVALLLTSLQIVGYLYDGEYAYNNLDADEYTYINLARDTANLYDQSSRYLEQRPKLQLGEVLMSRPNAVLDFIMGSVFNIFPENIIALNLVIDFIYIVLGFFIFRLFFLNFFTEFLSIVCAISSLVAPFLINYLYELTGDFKWFSEHIISVSSMIYRMPIQRGVYTQPSVILFMLSMHLIVKGLIQQFQLKYIIAAFICSALSAYVYFFGWLSSFVSISLFGGFVFLYYRFFARIDIVKTLPVVFFIHVLIALPSILIMSEKSEGLVRDQTLGKYFALPVVDVVLLICFIVIFQISKSMPKIKIASLLGISLTISNILLLNLQTILKQGLSPSHFGQYYLLPVSLNLFLGLIVTIIINKSKNKAVEKILPIIFLVAVLVKPCTQPILNYNLIQKAHEITFALRYLRESDKSNPVIAIPSVNDPFKPELSSTFPFRLFVEFFTFLSHTLPLHSEWSVVAKKDWEESLQRELLLGWIYSGKMQFLWPCNEKMEIPMPGDIFWLTWTYMQLRRAQQCSIYHDLPSKVSLCQLLKQFKIDYVLIESYLGLEMPADVTKYFSSGVVTDNDTYQIYNFNRLQAIADNCSS